MARVLGLAPLDGADIVFERPQRAITSPNKSIRQSEDSAQVAGFLSWLPGRTAGDNGQRP